MKKEIAFISPKNELLKDKIKAYYFHVNDEKQYKKSITYYPNFTSTLNIYKNSTLTWTTNKRVHKYQQSEELLTLLVGKFNRSRKIELFGPQNKITIVFNPLGINHFIDIPLSNLIQEHFSFFKYYGASFKETLTNVYRETKLEQKRDLLDEFFLNHYHPFAEKRLTIAVKNIINTNDIVKISDLASDIGISRRTLLRLFQKHLSYSIKEYLSVVKFRKALIQSQKNQYSLTRLAMEANYYDQSDFIKNTRLKSGESPKQLFANLKKLESELFWKVE